MILANMQEMNIMCHTFYQFLLIFDRTMLRKMITISIILRGMDV